jgi:hypothetical protein
LLDVERLAAAAGILDVGIVELEAFVQSFAREVELRAIEELQALRIDDDGDAVTQNDRSSGRTFIGIFDLVREPRAAGRAHAEAQPDALAAFYEAARRRASPRIRSM